VPEKRMANWSILLMFEKLMQRAAGEIRWLKTEVRSSNRLWENSGYAQHTFEF